MYCQKCGSELTGGSGFCPNCGASLKRTAADTQVLRWVILVAAILSIVATYLPAIEFMGDTVSFMGDGLQDLQAEGTGIIILTVIAGVLGWFSKGRMASFIPALLNIFVVYYDLRGTIDYGADWGYGAILIMLANLVIAVASVMGIVQFFQKKGRS